MKQSFCGMADSEGGEIMFMAKDIEDIGYVLFVCGGLFVIMSLLVPFSPFVTFVMPLGLLMVVLAVECFRIVDNSIAKKIPVEAVFLSGATFALYLFAVVVGNLFPTVDKVNTAIILLAMYVLVLLSGFRSIRKGKIKNEN